MGRGAELALLAGLVAGLSAGVGGVVLVEGEQGIGKSSVLRAGLAGAEAAGYTVLWGAADELGQRFPLQLMMQCLGSAAEPEQVGEFLTGRGGVMSGDPVLAGVERLLAVVDRLCARSPVVLVAEDLQWADDASVLVWSRLCQAVGQLPLLLAGSWRPGTGREDLGRLRRGVTSRSGNVVELAPLSYGEVAELVGKLVGGHPAQGLADVIGQAGGNPLYARELADELLRAGKVRLSGGAAELADQPARVPVPISLTAVIGERLDVLADDVVAALRWAAVLGAEFSVSDLEVVSGRSAGDLIGVVDAALSGGVVAEAGPAASVPARPDPPGPVRADAWPGCGPRCMFRRPARWRTRVPGRAGSQPSSLPPSTTLGLRSSRGWWNGSRRRLRRSRIWLLLSRLT